MVVSYKTRNEVSYHENSRGYLQYQIPGIYAQQIYGKKQKYISFGAKNSVDAAAEIKEKVKLLSKDLEEGVFDPEDLSRYKHSGKQVKLLYGNKKIETTLVSLFDSFATYRFSNDKESYGERRYRDRYLRLLKKSPQQKVFKTSEQRQIGEFITSSVCFETAKATLSALDRAVERGIDIGDLPPNNPNIFRRYLNEYRKIAYVPKRRYPKMLTKRGIVENHNKKAWTLEEMNMVIDAWRNRPKRTPYYKKCDVMTLLIEFLFYTGLRHGEAFGLKWKCMTDDLSVATISQSYNSELKVHKVTKNKKIRKIELSLDAQDVLIKLQKFYKEIGKSTTPDSNVFLKENNSPFRTCDLVRYWIGTYKSKEKNEVPGIVTGLVIDGKLDDYIDMYSTRRTFASLLAQGVGVKPGEKIADPRTVADILGDNVETVLKHYYSGQERYRPSSFNSVK